MSSKGFTTTTTFLIALCFWGNSGLLAEAGRRQLVKRGYQGNGDYGHEIHVSSSVLQLGSSAQHPALEHQQVWQQPSPHGVWVETPATNHYQPHEGGDIWLTEPEPIHSALGSVFSKDEGGHANAHIDFGGHGQLQGGHGQLHTQIISSSGLHDLPEIKEISDNVDFNNIADLKGPSHHHHSISYGK